MNKDFLEFKEKYNQIFKNNKGLEYFSWANFVPYDTDDLLFEMDLLSLNGQDYSSINDKMKKIWIDIYKLLKSYNFLFFTSSFGTNVKVTIHENGDIYVDEYFNN
jgi:hypothetical protein